MRTFSKALKIFSPSDINTKSGREYMPLDVQLCKKVYAGSGWIVTSGSVFRVSESSVFGTLHSVFRRRLLQKGTSDTPNLSISSENVFCQETMFSSARIVLY